MQNRKKNFLYILPSNYIIGYRKFQQNRDQIFEKVLNVLGMNAEIESE